MAWLGWVSRCRTPAFVDLGKKIRKHRAAIDAALEHDLSNAVIESTIIWRGTAAVVDVADAA